MMKWYKKVIFDNYANFSGRARREEFWMFFWANTIISLGLNFGLGFISPNLSLIGVVYNLAVLIPAIAVSTRRMHDVGKKGWYQIVPVYSLILACRNGQTGPNQYGADPKNEFEEIQEIGKD